MPDEIYQTGDIQGFDFAFDAVGQFIDWQPVIDAAQSGEVRLELRLAMLFTKEGEEGYEARARIKIPEGGDEQTIKQRAYVAIRNYIRNVGRRLGLDEDQTPGDAVALISGVTMS